MEDAVAKYHLQVNGDRAPNEPVDVQPSASSALRSVKSLPTIRVIVNTRRVDLSGTASGLPHRASEAKFWRTAGGYDSWAIDRTAHHLLNSRRP